MAWAGIKYREICFKIEDDLTHVFVLIEALGDCPLGVQGWHYKVFPPAIPISDIVPRMKDDDPVLWPIAAPTK